MKKKEKSLGRGLSSLICKEEFDELLEKSPGINILHAKVEDVLSNKNQPRKHFEEKALEELSSSIKQRGIISPILVRKKPEGKFEIIAGERRYRAAILAGLTSVPILLKEANDTHALELSIVENVQRQDLNVIEEARAYQALIDNYSYGQNDIAVIMGKSRSHIANILRLLLLPISVIELLRAGKITMGHAKVLMGRDNSEQLAAKIIENNLNVRQAEALINKRKSTQNTNAEDPPTRKLENVSAHKDEDIKLLESLLKEKANLDVKIDNSKKIVTICYDSLAELDNILQLLSSK